MTDAPPTPPPTRPPGRRLAAAVGIAVAAGAATVGVAARLDRPTGEGPRDSAPIVAGPVVGAITTPTTTGPATPALPPLAIIPSRGVGDGLADQPPEQQVARLRERIARTPTVRRHVELGRAYMALQDAPAAAAAFAAALRLAPHDPEALTGRAMVDGMSGSAGLATAAGRLAALQQRFPTSQVVVFNRGWVALYRQDVATVRTSWTRAVALDARSALGRLAAALLDRLNGQGAGG